MGAKSFRYKAARFLQLIEELIEKKAYKKKEISNHLQIAQPAFSSLASVVLPAILELDEDLPNFKEEVKKCFKKVNNVSQKKVMHQMDQMIFTLEQLLNDNVLKQGSVNVYQVLQERANKSYGVVKNKFAGLWDCYYYSSNKDRVKKEPFWIRFHETKKEIVVLKGNQNNTINYTGTAFMAENHTLVVQVVENSVKLNETLLMYFSVPIIDDVEFLRGMFIGLSYAQQPIARRVVLKKVADNCDLSFFSKIKTDYAVSGEHFEIMQYLTDKSSFVQSVSLINPTFDEQDLVKELEMLKSLKYK